MEGISLRMSIGDRSITEVIAKCSGNGVIECEERIDGFIPQPGVVEAFNQKRHKLSFAQSADGAYRVLNHLRIGIMKQVADFSRESVRNPANQSCRLQSNSAGHSVRLPESSHPVITRAASMF